MPLYYAEFSVDGTANAVTWDTGIESTEAEKKRIVAVLISVSGYQNNVLRGAIEREDILKIRDYVLDTYGSTGSTNTQYATTKINRIPIGHDLAVGRTFKIGIECGGTATNIRGAYEYEII